VLVGALGVLVVGALRFWAGRHSTPAPHVAGLPPEGPAQHAWLLARYRTRDGGAALGRLVAGLARVAPPGSESFFASLVAPGDGGTSFAELPVTPAGVRAGGPAYQPDAAAVQAAVQQHLEASRLTGERLFGRRLEILNGTGGPPAGGAPAHPARLPDRAPGRRRPV